MTSTDYKAATRARVEHEQRHSAVEGALRASGVTSLEESYRILRAIDDRATAGRLASRAELATALEEVLGARTTGSAVGREASDAFTYTMAHDSEIATDNVAENGHTSNPGGQGATGSVDGSQNEEEPASKDLLDLSAPPRDKKYLIPQTTWDEFKQALDAITGLSESGKAVMMMIFAAEGGTGVDKLSKAKGGITNETLRRAKTKGAVSDVADVAKAEDLTTEQLAALYKYYLDDTLRTIGGSAALDAVDVKGAAAFADLIFRFGRRRGAMVIQAAISDVFRNKRMHDEEGVVRKVEEDGMMGPATYQAYRELVGNPETHDEMLGALMDRRTKAVEEEIVRRTKKTGKQSSSAGDAARAEYFRFLPSK